MVLCWASENLVHSVIYNVFIVLSWQEFSHSCSQHLAETFLNPYEQARDGLTDFFQGSKDSVMAKEGLKYEEKKKSFSKSGNRNSRSWFIIMTGNVDWDAGQFKQLNFSKKKNGSSSRHVAVGDWVREFQKRNCRLCTAEVKMKCLSSIWLQHLTVKARLVLSWASWDKRREGTRSTVQSEHDIPFAKRRLKLPLYQAILEIWSLLQTCLVYTLGLEIYTFEA